MHFILFIISGIFIIFIRKIYFGSVFTIRGRSTNLLFWICSALACIGLNMLSSFLAGNHSFAKMIIILLSDFGVSYLLSLFFSAKNIGYRILMVFCYQIVLILTETLTGGLMFTLIPDFSSITNKFQDSVISVFASIFSFLIICIFSLLWKKKNQNIMIPQLISTCITPLSSLLFILFLPYQSIIANEKSNHIYFTFLILIVLNFLNYYFLNNLLKKRELQEQVHNQECQLAFQTEKFDQLSNTYKNTKRIVHEIKHRDNYLASCLQNKEYAKVEEELNKGLPSIDSRFFEPTTHNLVIDTFISSYTALANEKGIVYHKDIKTTKDLIPVSDYDLCILLGNILDNSFHAADKWNEEFGSYEGFQIKCQIISQERFFVIHIENPSISTLHRKKTADTLTHGFGLVNVKKIINEYSGFYHQADDGTKYETTISIPLF